MGAASLSPGRFSRSSSPNAISAPNASAAWTSWTPADRGLRDRPDQQQPGERDQQPLAGVEGLPGQPARLVPSAGHGRQRLSMVRSGSSAGTGSGAVQPSRSMRRDERVDEGGVELLARPLAQLGDRLGNRPRAPVGAVGGHRVEGVRHREHPGELGDLVARQPHRVAPAVDPLVVVHDPGERLVEEADLPDDVEPAHRVQLDGGVLVVGERAALLQHRRRHAELAHVVQHPRVADRPDPLRRASRSPRRSSPRRATPARCAPWCRSPWSPRPGTAR